MAPSGVIRSDLITEHGRVRAIGLVVLLGLTLAAAEGLSSARQFTSGVNVVEVYATVADKAGQPVTGLSREAFTVRENGDPQQITTFAAGEFPLSAAVTIDRSFSMAGERLASAKSGARSFLGGLRPTDESMLIAIGSTTEILAPLATNRREQLDALEGLDAFGTTGLYDSIVAALEAIQPARGRRALILLSDGDDRYSNTTAQEALERARASDVLVYPIALGRTRPQAFAELASLTGGRSFHVRDARQPRRRQREVQAFAGDGIDETRRVADQKPAFAGRLFGVELALREGRDRPAVSCQVVVSRIGVPPDPCAGRLEQVGARCFIGLPAGTDREVIRPREGPQVTGGGAREGNLDPRAAAIAYVITAGNRERVAGKRLRNRTPDQAVGAVCADQPVCGDCLATYFQRPT